MELIQSASLKQHQKLLVNLSMKQALHVLQLPLLELSEWLQGEIEANPILEIEPPPKARKMEGGWKEPQENLLVERVSLFEHLMRQMPLAIEENRDLAERIIGHLNEKGFLETPLEEIATAPLETMEEVLEKVQSLDPPGVGARNLQECLKIQLKGKGKEGSLAYRIVDGHFDDLVHNRLPKILQVFGIEMDELTEVVKKEIAPLDLYPGHRYFHGQAGAVVPDLIFHDEEGKWEVEVNRAFLPGFHISPIYKDTALRLPPGEAAYIRRQLAGGRWLQRIVSRRNETLRRIGELVLKRQIEFFNWEKGGLAPLTVQEAAHELALHESTVSRAIAHKFLFCPQGTYPLKSFFSQPVGLPDGRKMSKHNLRKVLQQAIDKEDKSKPMSDDAIAKKLKEMGIPCARRTVAKYRDLLRIAPAAKRRKWVGQKDLSQA